MVEPIAHYLIPTLILLAFLPKTDRKFILKLSPLAIISDFDFFIGHLSSLIAFYFLGSHLLLDTFGPGVGFFYPVYLSEATKDQLAPVVTLFGVIIIILISAGMVLKK